MAGGWQKVLETHALSPKSEDPAFWDRYLAENPDILHRLLADVHTATYGTERPPTLDDLWELVAAPQFAMEPFGQAVRSVLAGRGHSIRWLAQQVGLHQSILNRHLTGENPIVSIRDPKGSMQRIELVANALRLHPSYFMEWRRLWIMSLLDSAFTDQPHLSVEVFRRYAGLQERIKPRPNARSVGRR